MITSSIQRQRRARRLLVVLVALLPLALLTGLASGAVNLAPMQVLRGLLAGADGGQAAMIVCCSPQSWARSWR